MSMRLAEMMDTSQAAKDLSRQAIALALNGEWERAVEVNRAILSRSPDKLGAMGRLGKALMESARYAEARETLEKVVQMAPHKNIAKKNLVRLDQMEQAPAGTMTERRPAVSRQGFIEEGGKAGVTVLRKPADGQGVGRINSGDSVELVVRGGGIFAYTQGNECVDQLDTKLGMRLQRLMAAGNRYEAAVIRIDQRGVSVILRETYRDPSMRNVCSFPARAKEENRIYLEDHFSGYGPDDHNQEELGGAVDFLSSYDGDDEE